MRTHEVGLGSTSFQPRGPLMAANSNQTQQRPPVEPVEPDAGVVTNASMDGIDISDVDFPSDTDEDEEPMLIDLKPDVDSNPERAGQHPLSNNHVFSAVSTQTSPIREITTVARDPGTHESSRAESPKNSKCWICTNRPIQENSSFPTCGRQCTLELERIQSQLLSHGPTEIHSGLMSNSHHSTNSNICWVCNIRPRKNATSPICGWICEQELVKLHSQNVHLGSAEINRGHMSNPHHTATTSYASVAQSRTHNRVPMCQVCHVRPRYQRGTKTYPTCGLNCAAKLQPADKVEMCDFCKQRPKVVLNGKTYPQCGRTCRDKAKAAATGIKSNLGTCTTCLNCWKASADPPNEDFCSLHCKGTVESKSPILLEVPRGHVSFDKVENVFKDSWKQTRSPLPSVKRIYMVCLNRKWDEAFEDYGAKIGMGMPGSFKKKAQQHIGWIDMPRECKFGDPGNTKPCLSPKCAICNILQASFHPHMFGGGILTTSLPKAVESASNINHRTSKVVLLTKVHFSKIAEIPSYYMRETAPPHGFDAVSTIDVRQNGTKVALDQIYVFDNRAVRPVYLISFD